METLYYDQCIKKEYLNIMERIVALTIYGKKITKDSPIEDLIVAAYWAGVFGGPLLSITEGYIKDGI